MSNLPPSDSVSAVIGSFNASEWIGAAIESILSQTHPVEEVVIVDDGSTDRTAEIARSYGTLIRFVQEEHRGRPHRNRGVEISSGALVAFIDADDYWHSEKLERQLARMRQSGAEWVACDADWLDATTGLKVAPQGMALKEGDILAALFLHNFIVASTAVVSRRVLEEVGGFNEGVEVAPVEDWDLWLRIAERYPLACVSERLTTLRLHRGSFLASTPLDRRVRSLENVINRAASREPDRLGPRRALALHNAYFAAGVAAFRQGRGDWAREFFGNAWRQRRSDISALTYVGLTSMPSWVASSLLKLKRKILGRC